MIRTAFFVLLFAVIAGVGFAATPPALVNYEGVLRDQNGNPLTGSYDMVFRFMDASTLGNEILVDQHLGANGVVVSGGLFNVALGSGAVSDGSGPGTYTALDAVFRDYSAVWLEVQVGTETLSPRTQMESAPYALNATNLNGRPSSSFIDTSSSVQLKSGGLIVGGVESDNGGYFYASGSDPNGVGVFASGSTAGSFRSSPCCGTEVDLATPTKGIDVYWGDYAGYFSTNKLGSTGIYVHGQAIAGNFQGTVLAAAAGATGISATGSLAGSFSGSSLGVRAYGGTTGGTFENGTSGVSASLATGDLGMDARGTYLGGYFRGNAYGSYAEIPWYDAGMRAHGSVSGGSFDNFTTGAWGLVGYSSYKIIGSGAVSFAQNHPDDPKKVIVYAAPEGDEVAVYTRGSGRLVDGEARVALGETFALVANPDIGLTATVTPIDDVVPLAVVENNTHELVVRGPAGSNAAFHYMVWGLRIGFEEQSIVQPKEQDAKIPSMAGHEKFFAAEPALRSQTALARFKGIEEKVAGRSRFDLSRGEQLRDAIGVFTPAPPGVEPPAGPPGTLNPHPPHGALGSTRPQERPEDAGAGIAAPADETASARADENSVPEPHVASSGGVQPWDILMTAHGGIEPGDLLSLDPDSPGAVLLSAGTEDPLVIGCAILASAGFLSEGQVGVVTHHIGLCRVDASYAAIRVGDHLVASPSPGVAMRAEPSGNTVVLGRAIDPLEAGSALIRVLVGVR